MNRETVLIVDDDRLALTVLSDVLRAAGFEVSTHDSPLEALSAVERDKPDVIVADYVMPQMNGIAFLDLALSRSPQSARVLCTAAMDFRVALGAVNTGHVLRIVPKPVDEHELVSAVAQAAETVRLRRENERLTAELAAHAAGLEKTVRERTEALLHGFVATLDARDSGTQWHSQRVARYARRLGEHLGLVDPELTVVERGALLHDVGKIGVPDRVLLKEGPLTDEEWVEMRKHPRIGWALLQRVDYLRVASPIVLQHHERWDGGGYPDGLCGEEILLGARIFQVVDTYDAISTDRPYRRARSHGEALGELRRSAGGQLDPAMVTAFEAVSAGEWERLRREVDAAARAAAPE